MDITIILYDWNITSDEAMEMGIAFKKRIEAHHFLTQDWSYYIL